MRIRYCIILLNFFFYLFTGSRVGASNWKQLVRETTVLHCYEEDMKNAKLVISIVDETLPRIMGDLNFFSKKKVTIVIAPSEKEFQALTGGQIPEWGAGAADPSRAIIFLKSPRFARAETNLRQVVIHELSHVVLGLALGGSEIDRWFEEGFAQYESGERGIRGSILLARCLFSGDILWLNEIDEVLTFHRGKASLAYHEARSAVDYLIETYGKDILAGIVQIKSEGKGMDEALLGSTGVGFQDFETDWYHAIKRKYRWYILMDFPVVISTVFVALFITAFFATRRRIRKRKQIWENEELHEFERLEENSASN